MSLALFYLFAAVAVAGALGMVLNVRNTVAGALSLVATMLALGAIYVLLDAYLIGVLQILVYAGAIVVLFLFVIMLLNVGREEGAVAVGRRGQRIFALAGGLVLAGLLILLAAGQVRSEPPLTEGFVSLETLATILFRDHLLPFEIVGLLLLVAVVGAAVAARRTGDGESEGEP